MDLSFRVLSWFGPGKPVSGRKDFPGPGKSFRARKGPFLLSGLLFHQFLMAFNRFRKYIRLVEIGTGVMLMAVGIMLMFNLMGRLTIFLYQYLPVQG